MKVRPATSALPQLAHRSAATGAAKAPPADTFVKSEPSGFKKFLGKAGKVFGRYAKSALITAAPAIATTVALALGGVPAAGVAILGSMAVGGAAGAATWGKDIGIVRGALGGAFVGAFSGMMGCFGGIGITNMAAIGAGRELMFDIFSDVKPEHRH